MDSFVTLKFLVYGSKRQLQGNFSLPIIKAPLRMQHHHIIVYALLLYAFIRL